MYNKMNTYGYLLTSTLTNTIAMKCFQMISLLQPVTLDRTRQDKELHIGTLCKHIVGIADRARVLNAVKRCIYWLKLTLVYLSHFSIQLTKEEHFYVLYVFTEQSNGVVATCRLSRFTPGTVLYNVPRACIKMTTKDAQLL